MSTFLFFIQFMFYMQAIIDMNRKHFLMCQLGFMASPKKIKTYPYEKFLPTLSILDPASLNAWFTFRRVSLDYGEKYFYRHEIFLPVTLFLAAANIIVLLLLIYCLKHGVVDSSNNLLKIQYSLLIDAVLLFFISFHFMYRAGALNEEFDGHLSILQKNKFILVNLLQFRNYYFH